MTSQQEKVYRYILNHRGCTTHDIMRDTFIQCPSGRISELRAMGVDIQEIGTIRYEGTKAFVRYAIGKPLTKTRSRFEVVNGMAREVIETVAI